MLPTAPLALVLCWWSLLLETNSIVLSFAEKVEGARKGLVCTGPSNPHSAS